MPNNDDWLSALGYILLLREVGVHFTINRMLSWTRSGCGWSANSR